MRARDNGPSSSNFNDRQDSSASDDLFSAFGSTLNRPRSTRYFVETNAPQKKPTKYQVINLDDNDDEENDCVNTIFINLCSCFQCFLSIYRSMSKSSKLPILTLQIGNIQRKMKPTKLKIPIRIMMLYS
jgi:hypothetical protein